MAGATRLLLSYSTRRAGHIAFVHDGEGLPNVWEKLIGQIYLGSIELVEKMQILVDQQSKLTEIRYITEIIVNEMHILGGKSGGSDIPGNISGIKASR